MEVRHGHRPVHREPHGLRRALRPGRHRARLLHASPRALGFTLVELTIVVMILACIAAALALDPPGADAAKRLEAGATRVAMALRYARSEAVRTGEARGAAVVHSADRVFVAIPDLSAGEVALGSLVEDPLDKRDYDFVVSDSPGAVGVEIANASPCFVFLGLAPAQLAVVFDAEGLPFHLAAGVRYPLASGEIKLRFAGSERSVVLSPIGRVTLP